ncbi:hypothetical protein [Archangium sp.]|uniref:hypothetical protein n=1 Tax=Archangium sp. TaxID=1872627 RepID=UPI00286B3EE7|nr:hypothetical protein [Archangium sp.]
MFAIERLGSFLSNGNGTGLRQYQEHISEVAKKSPLALDPEATDNLSIPFGTLYTLVNRARNDALHQGAYARNLTTHAVELAIILEDALMTESNTVRDFMIRSPVCASLWQPLSFVRQTMLENSFSYLPVLDQAGEKKQWKLISDRALATYLREADRKNRLKQTLGEAVRNGLLALEVPHKVQPTAEVSSIFDGEDKGRPVLVFDGEDDGNRPLLGLLMPFDVL